MAKIPGIAKKKNKFNARKVARDGITFDSQKEADRYWQLKQLQKAGEIADLRCHVPYKLSIQGVVIGKYEADFVYVAKGKEVIEDVKGMKKGAAWNLFRWKAKHFAAQYGQEIRVV